MADYDVGYKKPPKEHRFKKGQSGNPAGRPKKKGPAASDLMAAFITEHIAVTKNGEITDVSRFEAFQSQVYTLAMKGDKAAMRLFIQMCQAAGVMRPAQKDADEAPKGGILAVPMFSGSVEDWAALPDDQVVPEVIGKET
ncbi:MAG: DUF5681 domain-containing protein [Oceanicaulis sp.]|jgi:hypothetical protein